MIKDKVIDPETKLSTAITYISRYKKEMSPDKQLKYVSCAKRVYYLEHHKELINKSYETIYNELLQNNIINENDSKNLFLHIFVNSKIKMNQ